MAGLLIVGITERDTPLVGVYEVGFFQVAILKGGIPEVT
jgi:hypothetical protein